MQRRCLHATAALILLLLPALPACATELRPGPPLQAAWAQDAVWDDGLAEVAIYDASRVVYGKPRPYQAVLITVKEDFDAATLVKADPPLEGRDLLPVLKLNTVREIPTPNYDYRMMTSVFVRRDDPAVVVKLTHTCHEWCGNVCRSLRREGDALKHRWSSYFDGEAEGDQTLTAGAGALAEDQLALALRGLAFADGLRFRLKLLPSVATNRGGPLAWEDAEAEVRGPSSLDTPAGAFDVWEVRVSSPRGTGRWWFAASGTHPLIRAETLGGDRLLLRSLERRAYWNRPPE